MPEHKFSLVASARWEDKDILEWLDYHRLIGVDHVYLYSNDDDASVLRNAIGPHGDGPRPFVTYRHWDPCRGRQAQMYSHFLMYHRHETEWLCFLDIDEFLVIKGHNDLSRFMAPLETRFDAVYFNWVIYGTNGRLRRRPGSVLTGLTRRNRGMDPHTKNFIRSSFADPWKIWPQIHAGARAFWHFWDDYDLGGLRACDVLGVPLLRYAQDFPVRANALIGRPGFQERAMQTAYVAHFQFKSEADFKRRAARGGNPAQRNWLKLYKAGQHKTLRAENDEVPDDYLSTFWERHRPRRPRAVRREDAEAAPGRLPPADAAV